ncbi:hypothetical protein Tco_1072893, partial [Tanacetum coccineum]
MSTHKRYALMDANKKIGLDNPLCPNESKIMANILQNHPLRFSIAPSSSVSWIYFGHFWHTLKEDGSKFRLKFVIDRKELTLTLDDFRRVFKLPQATNNTHKRFVAAPKFSEMVPFFLNDLGESSAQRKSTVIRFRILPRRSTRLTPSTSILNAAEVEDMVLQDTIQLIIPVQKRTKNVDELVSSILNSQNDPGTRLDLRSYKEILEVEITTVVQPINVTEEEEESAEDDYELRRRVKGKHVEEYRNTPSPTPIRSPRTHSTLISSDTKKFQELTVTDPKPSSHTKPSYSLQPKTGRFKRFHKLASHLQEVMEQLLSKMVDDRVKELTKTQVLIYVANGLLMEQV